MCLCVGAHQTSVVVLFFADYLHQQVVFPLGFLHLTDKLLCYSPINISTESHVPDFKKGTDIGVWHPVNFTALPFGCDLQWPRSYLAGEFAATLALGG